MRIYTTCIYVVWRNHILLIRRSKDDSHLPNWWESPGGHVDRDCGTMDNVLCRLEALRELREETGIHAQPQMLKLLPREKNSNHLSYLLNLYSTLPPKVVLSNEHSQYRWDTLQNPHIPIRRPMRRQVRDFIVKARKGIWNVK